jgi:hypothetical protein
MDQFGINAGFLLVRLLFTLAIPIGWLLLSLLALFGLRGRNLDQTTQALWALLIVSVPILGALAFWIVRPGEGHPAVHTGS